VTEIERIIESEVDENAWRQHITRYEFAKQFVEGKPILDVACGTGYGTYFLARACKTRIVGVDVSEEAIGYARAHYTYPGLEYHNGDALSLRQYAGIEAVVSLETIEHLAEPERFLDEVVKTLPSGGTFIVSTPNRATGRLSDKPRNPFHVREWNATEFMQLLSRYFGDVEFYDQFVYIGQSWYPGSRMLSDLILRTLRPDVLTGLCKWEVTRPHNTNIPLVKLLPKYIVAVCARPKQ
jgi:ubiquinone/menaquinone biosynthesis C-methylase UbiE